MVTVLFLEAGDLLTGFEISGHSGYARAGKDIVCASISSCAYLVANTVTDVLHLPAIAEDADGRMTLRLKREDAAPAQAILCGFLLHAEGLSQQYPAYMQCKKESL